MKLQEQLRTVEGRQARVGAVAASELEAALAAVSGGGGVLRAAEWHGARRVCLLAVYV